ncbi:MAG: putative beta-lysine N-acetyltransferase [Phycisphaerae bacterium]|nr:putative beta-lysine N-acetyltransferase [Phycisphaerae bacterium]
MELFHDALIQHGPLSNRIYLMKLNKASPVPLIEAIKKLAESNRYTKIFAKVPAQHAEFFIQSGYEQEAAIPDLYDGQEDAIFLGHFLDPERQKETSLLELENIIDLAQQKRGSDTHPGALTHGAILRCCVPDDAVRMSKIYKEVFPSYPFPIDDPHYLIDTMAEQVVYFGVEINNELVALSSAEMDTVSKNVEMTDFATLPKFRSKSYASRLLRFMENEMRARGIQTAYTIARAISPGMNITFGKAGYTYGGRLINNTNIAGQIENMNVWHKFL